MKARDIALRDPALAALTGAVGDDFGVEFGGVDFGDDWGAEVAPMAIPAPTKEQAMQAFAEQYQQKALMRSRQRVLEPNKGSPLKVERYSFSVNQALTLGTALNGFTATNNPTTNFRPQRGVANSPQPGFVTLTDIKVANVSVLQGAIDSYMLNANAYGTHMDLPTLTPALRLEATGNYTGFVPPGYVAASAFTFNLAFTGPASVIA